MKKHAIVLLILFVAGTMVPDDGAMAEQELRIGVLAKDGAIKCLEMWDSHGAYIEQQLGGEFLVEIEPLDFTEVDTAIQQGKVQFFIVNSAISVNMFRKYRARPVLTMINSRKGKGLAEFGGVIFVHKASPVKTLEDISGKDMMIVKLNSFGGGLMQRRLLRENGIRPATLVEAGTHGGVIQQILENKTIVGCVRTDALERLAHDRLGDLRVIDPNPLAHMDFPFLCSTQLYPEWPFSALDGTPIGMVKRVASALRDLSENAAGGNTIAQEALKYAKIIGWTISSDYSSVGNCIDSVNAK